MADKIDSLFDDLQARGFAKDKTRDDFRKYMLAPGAQGYQNRKDFFDDFKGQGMTDLNSYEDFANLLGLRAAKPTQQYNPESDSTGAGVGAAIGKTATELAQKPINPNLAESVQQTIRGVNEGFDQFQGNLESYYKQKPLGRGVAKGKQRWNQDTGEFEQTYLTGAGTEHTSQREAEDIQKMWVGDERTQLRKKAEFADDELERALAEREKLRYANPNDPKVAQAIENNEAYIQQLQRNDTRLRASEMEINDELADIRRAEEENAQRIKASEPSWWDDFRKNFAAGMMTSVAPDLGQDLGSVKHQMALSGAFGSEQKDVAKELDVLKARKRLAEDAKSIINDIRLDQKMEGWGLARAGMKVAETALNPNTWDWGKGELETDLAIAEAVIKADSGLGISDNERKLLDTWAKNTAIQSQFGEQLSGWTKSGMVTGESLPFMLEMAMNPAAGLGKGATEKIAQYASKKAAMRFLKEGIEKFGKEEGEKWAKRKGAEYLRNHMKGLMAKKIATRAVGDITAAEVMASTSGSMRVMDDAIKRMTGDVDIELADNGDVYYNGTKAETKDNPTIAVLKALGSTGIENWSEMAGEYMGFLNDFFGKAIGRAVVGKQGRKALDIVGNVEGVTLNKAQKFIYELAAGKGIGAFSEGLGKFAKQTQWHGVVGEYLEEVIGNIANAATVGDMTFDTAKDTGVFNLEQNIDTFCGVALMGGFMSALHTGGFIGHRIKYSPDRVSNANAQLFGEENWNDIKAMIDNSHKDPRELNDALTYLLRGKKTDSNGMALGDIYNNKEKEAILEYTQAVLEKDGADMVNYQPRMYSSTVEETNGADGKKQYVVSSFDKYGTAISQQAFDTEDEAQAFEGELKMQQQQKDYNDYLDMSSKLSYAESADLVDQFMGRMGASEMSDEAYAQTISDINDPNSALGKQFQKFKNDAIIQKARVNQAQIDQFEQDMGWEPGTVKWLSEQDPMQMDNEGLQMMDTAREFLESLAYPSGEIHIEHEQQKGAEAGKAVVEQVISTEEEIDPNNNAGQQIREQYQAAEAAYNQMLANDKTGDVVSELNDAEKNRGLSPQEILSSLETFTPQQRQIVADYYNAKARWESYKDEAAKQIDSVARRDRERRTFKGTINGQPNYTTLVTVTDDGGNSYYLASGNITSDTNGNVTDSDSGLIIAVDAAGNFVQLNDKHLTVTPIGQPLAEYEAQRREELQKQVTFVTDSNGTMDPALQQQPGTEQGGNQDNAGGEAGGTNTGANEPSATALSKIPVDEKGQPLYTQALPEDTYDALVEQVGEQGASTIAQSELNDARKRLEKLTKDLAEGKVKGNTAQEKIVNMQQMQQAIQSEQNNIAHWESVLNVPVERKKNTPPPAPPAPVITAKQFIDRMEAAGTHQEVDAIFTEGLKAGIPEKELMPTYTRRHWEIDNKDVPEYRYDTPEAARKRGYKKVEGQRIDRQEEKPMPQGMEVEVQYSTKDKVKGRLTVSELGEVQGSHLVNGQRNEKNFIPEAQPKAEFGADRQAAAQTNASEANFRPELMLTFNGTQSAYSGSTTQTNRRGEVIQGNGRRNLAEYIYAPGNEAVAQRYKEFLMAHADELGTTAEAIAQMEKPFAHIVLDVTDEEAIRLGQFTAADLETGGKKIPEVASTATKLGNKFSNLANIVLRHEDPDASLAERIEANADDAVRWLNQGGYINNTEAKTLLEDKAAARQFIKDLLTDTLFSGASPDLRTMFYELPKNIQSAIVSVIGREVAASQSTSILKDIQESIQAYHELMTSSPQFAGAKGKNFEERFRAVTAAVNDWLRQINIDSSQNKEKYSNFALHLAKLYQSLKDQKTLAAKLREYYDLVSGSTRQLGMFDDNTTSGPVTREEAIKLIFGVEYGRQGTVPLASDIQAGQGGEQGGSDRNSGGERGEGEGGPSDTGGGDTGNAPEGEVGQNPPTPPTPPSANNTPLTTEEIDGSDFPKQVKTLAKAYLNGNHGELQTAAYNDIYEEVRGSQPATPKSPQQPITTSNPIEAINEAAASFREGQNQEPETPPTPPTPPSGETETPEQKRARLKQEILAKAQALKDAQKNRKNDGGQAMSVIDPLTALAAEGARIVKKSIIPQSKEERKIFWDLVQTTADYGFTYIQEGVTNFKEWSKRVYDDVVSTMQDIFEWTQEQVDEYINQVWNSEVEVDGKAKTLAEFAAEKSNNAKDDISSVNVNKKENNEPENSVSLQSETINSEENGLEQSTSNVRPEGQRDGNNEGKPSERVRQGAQQEGGGLDGQGQAEGAGTVGGSNQRPAGRLQGLNKNNNHEERGTESAPSTPRMRTQANIEAIRLMQQIIEEDRPATDEEKKILRKFSGWGGLGVAFEDPTYSEELRSLLGDAAYDQAQMSRNSAYFTPANIIDAMWDIAKALGFKGGNVLEGSAGIGKIIGLMPAELSDASNIQAVEIDETTGNILKLLYPDAQVDVQGFEDTKIPNGSIDLAITNVPFVTGLRVQDTTGDKDLSKMFHDIHDFCIAKNIRKLREGGIGIFITSNGTLDNSQKLRDWIISEGGADVVGAFRLNNKTFGGTGTTSDIIVVRKRVNGQKSPNAIDVSLPAAVRGVEYDTGETKKVKGQEVPVIKKLSMDYNGYFVEHPEHMGGEMVFNFEIGETYRPTSKTLTPGSVNQNERLNAWVDEMSKKDWSKEASAETSEPEKPQYEKYGKGVKEGSLILDSKGNICIAQYGEAVPLGVNDKKVKGRSKQECLKDYNAIKNALNEVLNYQVEHEDNDGLRPLLDKLNKAYNQFVAKYGHFHNNTAIAFLRNDVDYASVGALETYKEKTDKDGNKTPVYGKADVFSKRVVEKEKEPQPKTIEDGVIASIYKYGGINIPYIAQQLGMSEEETKEEILDKGLGFENPDTTQVEVSYVYLSGNVREKLEKAKANNANGKYAKNISALEKIIPADIPAHLIEFNLGSTWIDKELYKEFFKEKTGKDATFNDANGTWFLGYNEDYTPKDAEGAVFSELCDKTILTSQLIEAAMTGRTIKVQKTEKGWDGKTETITDNEATQACAARIDELKQDFKDWARAKMQAEPEWAEKIEKAYNDQFNNYVPLSIPKEFAPTHFGGQNKSISMREHQSKAVIKGITQPIMFAHGVGAGKTFTLIATAMEMRRIGTAKKPMIVVQNATVGQFTESAKELYPAAKILTMDEKDHSEAARKQFYAKIKYNDWDLIIVPQSVLDKIPDSPDRQLAYINEKIQEKERILMLLEEDPANWAVVNRLRKELDEMYDEEYNLTEASAARSEKKKKRDEKKRAVAKQNAAVRAKEQLDRSVDDVEDFDDMEIDAILVDEAHNYKKLGFGSVMQRVKGVDTGSSKKCASLLLKTRAVLEKSHGKNVVFATGTPVSNTAAEVWTFMRYLMPEEKMEEYGIKFFDDFARNFGNVQQMLEFTTSGKFKENNRFAGYVNMPELARIWASIADTVEVQNAKEVKEKLPEIEGGKATDIYLPQTKALRAVMKYVRQELERYEHMTGKEKKANSYIPLVMYGIAKAAAVDARLVDSTAADEPQSKTNEAVRQTLRSLEETKEYNGTIAIFADNYQNKQSGFNLYEDIKKKLVAQGVPSEQIAIIRSDMSDKKKLDIFDKVNSGEIRVVMGSTQTLGTGVNIQERLHTLIHMDAPNRPMDYTQRNGRIERQGNLHKEWGIPVRILRFGVEDSLDVTAYQRLKTKGAIADSVMKGDKLLQNAMDSRVLEEEEDVFGDTVAQLSGSEYAMLKNQAEKEVRKLEARYKQWEADQIFVHAQMPRLLGQSDASRLRMEKAEKNLATVEKAMKQPLKIEINGKSYDSLDAMADFFRDYNSKIKAAEDEIRKSGVVQSQDRKLTITINGIPFEFKTIITGSRSHEKGKIKFSTMRQTTFNNEDLIGSERNVKGGYIKNGVEEILNDYLSGNDYREIIETEKNSIARNEAQIKMLEERSGKEFTEGEALEKARERLEEYTQKMKEEMEAKEAKYKEMDAEVEASDSVTMSDEDEDSDAPNRMITTSNPMEAIEQAAESWRQQNRKSVVGKVAQEIKDFVDSLPTRFGLNGGAPTYVINSREDLDALKGKVKDRLWNEIDKLYKEPDAGAAYIPRYGVCVVFGEKLEDAKEGEMAWWHEQAHGFWQKTPEDVRKKYGEACLEYLRENAPSLYNHIKKEYPMTDWLNEACSYLIGEVIRKAGTEKFLAANFVGNEEICNFANELRNYIKNGTRESNNQLRRDAVRGQGSEVQRGNPQGRERGSDSLRSEEKPEVTDPIQAIEQSAKLYKRGRANAANEEASPEYSAKKVYHDRIYNNSFVITEAFQDAMLSLKNAINAIARDKDIPDSQNPYVAENLMHGKVKNQMDEFNRNYKDPLMDTIKKILKATGMNYGDIDRYVYTKSGLERNREFFVRDWLEAERKRTIRAYEELNEQEQEIYQKMANGIETKFEDGDITEEQKNKMLNDAVQEAHDRYINDLEQEWLKTKRTAFEKLNNGQIDFKGYLEELTDFIQREIGDYDPNKSDYSGFRDMFGDDNGKYDEADIIEDLMKTEEEIGAGNVGTLWNQIREANRYSLERYREAGMRTDEQIDKTEQMFNFYVPMRGFAKETGEDMYQYMTNPDENGVRHLGGLLKHAKGRKSEAEYPIATMFVMAYKTISDCEQNLVNQKLYRLCQANPNDLIVLSDGWATYDERTDTWEESMPEIPDNATEEEARRITLDWLHDMQELAKEGKAKKIKGTPKFDYMPKDPKKKAEHVIEVRMNGQKKLMTVVGNPRLAQALNGQLRFKGALGKVSSAYAKLKNFMASTFTSWSPTFAMRNMWRDWTHFRMMLSVREGETYARAANKYYKETLPRPYHGRNKFGEKKEGMVELFKKYRAGTLDMSKEVERDFQDFMDNGGTTGFVFMQKLDDLQREMENLSKDMDTDFRIGVGKYTISFKKPKKLSKAIELNDKMISAIFDTIEAYNEAVENNARFATFRASRHVAGRTKSRSAYDAKEITVNFNRKGAGKNTASFKNRKGEVPLAAQVAGATAQTFGEGRVFFNATLQAIATTFKNFRNPDGSLNKPYIAKWAARYASIPFAFGFMMPLINEALASIFGGGDDDDPYANLPDWVRRNNLCLYIGNDNFITIPIGQELAAFLALGDIAAGLTYRPELQPVDKDWMDEVMSVLNTFSPIEIEQKVTKGGLFSKDWLEELAGKAFSVLTPIISVSQNRSWTGRQIFREDKNEKDAWVPEYQKAYSGTNPLLMSATKGLHELGGGNERKRGAEWSEWNPGMLQYLWEQYTGGPGKTLAGIISSGRDAIEFGKQLAGKDGEPDFNIKKVEGIKAFVTQGDDRTAFYRTKAKFNKYEKDAEKYKYENDIVNLEKQEKAGDPVAKLELERLKKGVDFTRFDIIREANRQNKKEGKIGLDDFRREMYKLTGKERKEAEKWYNNEVKKLVDELDKVQDIE